MDALETPTDAVFTVLKCGGREYEKGQHIDCR